MFASPIFDVAGPGVFLLAGGMVFAFFSIGTFVIESLVLWLLKWGPFGRSLLAAFLMNLASTLFGFFLFGLSLLGVDFFSMVLVGFVLSFFLEGGVLMLMNKGESRRNWIASLVANLTSYGLLGLVLLLFIVIPQL
ncbi:MAG: hypothetical protein FJZ87_10940 [Chloroflexi bacterium]|nr:hypothetical protein [Chloroflexota bacterium]